MSNTKIQNYITFWPIGLFIICLICFVLFVSSHLDLPYFWDESWVYGPAVRLMAVDGLSMLPNGLDVTLSRGHPLLFHNIYALWLQLFGNTIFNSHLLSLFVSLAYLVSLFYITSKWMNYSNALFVCLYLMLQQIYIAQSCLVLPEILLSIFLLWSLYFFVNKNWLAYIIMLSLAFWIKESTLAFYGAFILISGFTFSQNIKKPRALIFTILPGLSFILFLVLNKLFHGWFLFPEHTNLLAFDPFEILQKLKEIFTGIFISEKRNLITLLLGAGILYTVFQKDWSKILDHKIYSMLLVILVFSIFSSLNFYTVRYILPILTLPIFLSIYFMSDWNPKLRGVIHVLIISILVWNISLQKNKQEIRDINISYVDYVQLKKEAIQYLEQQNIYDHHIRSGFLIYNAMNQTLSGYRTTEPSFQFLNDYESEKQGKIYTVLNSIEPTDYLKDALREKSTLLQTFKNESARIEIYVTE